jgi:hypothetical protein
MVPNLLNRGGFDKTKNRSDCHRESRTGSNLLFLYFPVWQPLVDTLRNF